MLTVTWKCKRSWKIKRSRILLPQAIQLNPNLGMAHSNIDLFSEILKLKEAEFYYSKQYN